MSQQTTILITAVTRIRLAAMSLQKLSNAIVVEDRNKEVADTKRLEKMEIENQIAELKLSANIIHRFFDLDGAGHHTAKKPGPPKRGPTQLERAMQNVKFTPSTMIDGRMKEIK